MAFFQSLGRVTLFDIILSGLALSHTHRYLLPVGAFVGVTRGEPTSTAGSEKDVRQIK